MPEECVFCTQAMFHEVLHTALKALLFLEQRKKIHVF
jgi:hypothetical protein